MHLVQPNRHPAGQQLDSYYSTKILENVPPQMDDEVMSYTERVNR